MSVIGVSPSDFMKVATVIQNIYNAYKNGSQKLEGVLGSLKELETQAKSLKDILQVANVQDCPTYEGFDNLKRDLEKASLFLAKFQGLSEATHTFRRAKDATNMTMRQDEFADWQKTLAEHRARMESYKTLLILYALLNNRREADLEADVDDIDDKILQRAIRVIEKRRKSTVSTPDPNQSPLSLRSNASTLVPWQSQTQKLYEDIVAQAESSQLYYRNQDPQDNPKSWAEIMQKLTAILPDRRSSTVTIGSPVLNYTASPEAINIGRELTGDSVERGHFLQIQIPSPSLPELEGSLTTTTHDEDNTDRRLQAPQTPLLPLPVISNGTEPGPIDSYLILDESRSQPMPLQNLAFAGKVQVAGEMVRRVCGKEWMEVYLQISQDESSTHIWASSTPPRSALTPQDILQCHAHRTSSSHDRTSLTLKHTIRNQVESFPAVHHPAVEKTFDIRFGLPQIVTIEGGLDGPERISGHTYRFEHKEDRDELRSKIYDKRLLCSAGYDIVTPAGVCFYQALTLWEDKYLDVNGRTILYITLPCNMNGTESGPDRAMTLRVLGSSNLESAKKKSEPLSLNIVDVSEMHGPNNWMDRRASLVSNSTTSSKSSKRKRGSEIQRSSTCKIKFSDKSQSCKDNKKKFLRVLKEKLEAG